MDKSIPKIISNMDMQLMTLAIHCAQIENDLVCKGAKVAIEALRKEVEMLKKELES